LEEEEEGGDEVEKDNSNIEITSPLSQKKEQKIPIKRKGMNNASS
jgi:hypothetical protein